MRHPARYENRENPCPVLWSKRQVARAGVLEAHDAGFGP